MQQFKFGVAKAHRNCCNFNAPYTALPGNYGSPPKTSTPSEKDILVSIRVLLVDDEVHIRTSMSAFLEDEGYTVTTVGSAEDALEKLKNQEFDIGVIDLRLPGMDGEKLILHIIHQKPAMQFLIHTGSADFEITPELSAHGMTPQDIIKKPVKDMGTIALAIQSKCPS